MMYAPSRTLALSPKIAPSPPASTGKGEVMNYQSSAFLGRTSSSGTCTGCFLLKSIWSTVLPTEQYHLLDTGRVPDSRRAKAGSIALKFGAKPNYARPN